MSIENDYGMVLRVVAAPAALPPLRRGQRLTVLRVDDDGAVTLITDDAVVEAITRGGDRRKQ